MQDITTIWKASLHSGDMSEFSPSATYFSQTVPVPGPEPTVTVTYTTNAKVNTSDKHTGTHSVRFYDQEKGVQILDVNDPLIGFWVRPTTQSGVYYLIFKEAVVIDNFNTANPPIVVSRTYKVINSLAIKGSSNGGLEFRGYAGNDDFESSLGIIQLERLNVWQQWQVDTRGGYLRFWIDGKLMFKYAFHSVHASCIVFGSGGIYPYIFMDDFYAGISATLPSDDLPTVDKRFRGVKPMADATPKEWTPSSEADHYSLLDEVPVNQADYIRVTAPDLSDAFIMNEPVPEKPSVIKTVYPVVFAKRGEVLTDSRFASYMADGESNVWLGNMNGLSTDSERYQGSAATAPDGTEWTPAKIASVKHGIISDRRF